MRLLPSARMKTALTLMAMAALGLAMVYSNALPFGYPMMTGLMFEQLPVRPSARTLRVVVDLALVVAVGLALRWALLRFAARPFLVGLLIANVSLVVAASVAASRGEVGGAGGPDRAEALPEQPLRFSRTAPNVLIVFLDRFMGSYVETILQEEPALADRLSGFTWYPRTVSAGENSIAGVHPMLGGYDYLPGRDERPTEASARPGDGGFLDPALQLLATGIPESTSSIQAASASPWPGIAAISPWTASPARTFPPPSFGSERRKWDFRSGRSPNRAMRTCSCCSDRCAPRLTS